MNENKRFFVGISISSAFIIISLVLSFLAGEEEVLTVLSNSLVVGAGSFMGWWIVSDIDKLGLSDKANKDEQLDISVFFPKIISFIGLVLLVLSMVAKELSGVLFGALLFLVFMNGLFEEEYFKLQVFQRLGILLLSIIYFVYFSTLFAIIFLLLGILALVDVTSLIFWKKPLSRKSK